MPRRMRDLEYSLDQFQRRYDPPVAPLNRFIDQLGESVPYIPPFYGGVNARLLSVLRDPGPMANKSGFICMENDDPTAEALWQLFHDTEIPAEDIVPWNAYPWYINQNPNAAQLRQGTDPLKKLIEILPLLKVVMLHGGVAHRAWHLLEDRYPSFVSATDLHVIMTYHPSRQAFWHRDPVVRDKRRQHLRNAFAEARCVLLHENSMMP